MFGCIEPDLNPFTYLRGSLKKRLLRGHNAENVQSHIQQCIKKLQRSKRQSAYWYFSLGTLMHYIADSFTYPHNVTFSGGLLQHRAYEKSLHKVFEPDLSAHAMDGLNTSQNTPWRTFDLRHRQYISRTGTMETDCRFIVMTCQDILASLLSAKPSTCTALDM